MENKGVGEIVKRSPVFEDKGKILVISGEVVEEGTYYVHTSESQKYPSPNSRTWETLLNITRDGGLVETDYRKTPHLAYGKTGKAYELWNKSVDPDGEKAKVIHQEVVKLVKQNIPIEEIDRRVNKMVDEIDPEGE